MSKEINILLVEDSEEDAFLIQHALEKGGIAIKSLLRVQTSSDFRRALEANSWDLVIADYVLPSYSGLDALNEFRNRDLDIPFIMVSGKISEEAAVEIMKAGARDFILKQKLPRLPIVIERELKQADLRREKKKAESELLESEEKYRSLIGNIPDVTWIYDQTGTITFISENVSNIYGFSAQEILANPLELFRKRIHPEDAARVNLAYNQAFEKKKNINLEYRIQHKQGYWIWINDRATTFFADKDTLFARAVFYDISARKAAELSLMESEEKYRILIENIPDITWIADKEGNVVFISPHIKDITGFDAGEIYSGGFNITFGQIHPEDIKRAREKYENLFAKNAQIDEEVRFRRKDGEWLWFHIRSLNTYFKNGVAYATGLMTDVTEQKKTKIKIKELDELKTKFIQIVNHQMRTPLTVIRWNLENLIEKNIVFGANLELLKMIEDTTLEIIGQLSDLLTAMDIKEGRIGLNKRPISIDTLVTSVLTEFKHQELSKNIKIFYERPSVPLPTIEIDPDKIREAFSKIIENAVTYVKEKGAEIIIKTVLENGILKFEVSDNGIGIPEAEQDHIFTSFFRASNASKIKPGASGIGLSIAKYFVEQNGGRIGFKSAEGEGSTFWITFSYADLSKGSGK